jgi:hypothetical protein
MKNIYFFAISFLVCGTLTFGLSKTRQQDKLGDAILIGILGAGVATYIFNGVSNAYEEEEFIDNNTTQLKVRTVSPKTAANKYLSADGKKYKMPVLPPGDESGFLDDVSETGFFAEREQLASEEVSKQLQKKK